MAHLITFIGFGEAASAIAGGLKEEGMKGMTAYDVMQDTEPQAGLIRKRAADTGVRLADNLEEALEGAEYILSLNSAKVCVDVAKQIVPLLKAGQTLVDCNSAAPTSMSEIAGLDFPEGVKFCDAAMMGSVPAGRHQVKMYLSGNGAQGFYDAMQPYHTVMTVLDAPAGGASAIKMFKSVWSKGIPQLIIESLMPAAQYGVYKEVLSGIKNPFNGDVEENCKLLVYRTMIHATRRSAEMHDVSETVETLGFDASMSRAAEHRLKEIGKTDYKQMLEEGRENLDVLINTLVENWK